MSTRRALLFSFLDRYCGLIISIAASMAIARLLPPSEMGIFSVGMALLLLANTVRDMGAGQYIVQVKQLTSEGISAVWTIQLGIGAALAILTAAIAVPAAAFYQEPKISGVLVVMSVGYLINPFGSITYALLMREMRFERVALMRLAAALSSAVVSTGLAYYGHGVMSLAWGSLAATVANALVALWMRPTGTPWGLSVKGIPEVIGFSGRLAGTSVITTIVVSTPDFLLGKFQDMHAAGLYSRSNGLVSMFSRLIMDAVQGVALSLFSQQRRAGQDMKPALLKAMSYIIVLNWMFCALLALLALPITVVLYGNQWGESVNLTRWLALSCALGAPVVLFEIGSTAAGRSDLLMRATFLSGCITVAAMLVGTMSSLETLGQLIALASLCSTAIWAFSVRKTLGVCWKELFGVLCQSAITTILAMALPIALMYFHFQHLHQSQLLTLLALGTCGLACAVGAVFLTKHPLATELRRLLKNFLGKFIA
ncbi:oligosaccharide flippase family protein [Roseateles oligotrophus]|uniref:Oligosaccharide flippase family protein n=1 Tax=Roseateles oligotrophus TaxID=1769250 RepID=A0ABT2YFC4_9BURK|nr:oligosaccharide flippase family protein [Roseateles oligotrophus]MCV2368744.1 oligosaccharide flippase family protein [Roseateles oligotrophus]